MRIRMAANLRRGFENPNNPRQPSVNLTPFTRPSDDRVRQSLQPLKFTQKFQKYVAQFFHLIGAYSLVYRMDSIVSHAEFRYFDAVSC